MNYFLVSWLVSSLANNGQWINKIIVADTADDAILQDLIEYYCVPPETTVEYIKLNKHKLDFGVANNLTYKANISNMDTDNSNAELLQVVKTDCGLKVFVPNDILDWHKEEEQTKHEQPFKVSVAWTVGDIKHNIEDTVWSDNIHTAAIDGVLSCTPTEMNGYKDNTKEMLELSDDYSIKINGEHYALTKIEVLRHVTITINEHRIYALIPNSQQLGQSPVLAQILQ